MSQSKFSPIGVVLSKDTMDYIAARAACIHHGSITIHINRDAAKHVDVEVLSRERFEAAPEAA